MICGIRLNNNVLIFNIISMFTRPRLMSSSMNNIIHKKKKKNVEIDMYDYNVKQNKLYDYRRKYNSIRYDTGNIFGTIIICIGVIGFYIRYSIYMRG